MLHTPFLKLRAYITFRMLTLFNPLLTVKGYASLLVGQAAGQCVDTDAVVVMALRRWHGSGSGNGSKGLSSRNLRGSVFKFGVPKGRSPELRNGP